MHTHDLRTGAVLRISILLMLALAAAEALAGYWTQSLALLSDAGHNFTDSVALLRWRDDTLILIRSNIFLTST